MRTLKSSFITINQNKIQLEPTSHQVDLQIKFYNYDYEF